MEKILLLIIMVLSFSSPLLAKPKRESPAKIDKSSLSRFISTFDLIKKPDGTLQAEMLNVNGQKKTVELSKIEEFNELTRYSLQNPFAQDPSANILNIYIFEKVKPTLLESKESMSADAELSDIRVDLVVLMDFVTRKTIKTKSEFFYKDYLVAEGSLENNAVIKIKDDLSGKIKNYKLQELRVTKNLLGSDKRSLDVELKVAQAGKQIRQKLNVNLLNMKLTPVKKPEDEIDQLDEELDLEGEENETTTTHS